MGSQNMRWRIVRVSHKQPSRDDPTTVDVFASKIEPKLANTIVRRLCQIAPLEDLRHVKRVRKIMVEGKIELSVILCTVIDCKNREDMPSGVLEIVSANRLSPYLTNVPKFAGLFERRIGGAMQTLADIISSTNTASLNAYHFPLSVVNAAIIMDPATKQIIASGTDQT